MFLGRLLCESLLFRRAFHGDVFYISPGAVQKSYPRFLDFRESSMIMGQLP